MPYSTGSQPNVYSISFTAEAAVEQEAVGTDADEVLVQQRIQRSDVTLELGQSPGGESFVDHGARWFGGPVLDMGHLLMGGLVSGLEV